MSANTNEVNGTPGFDRLLEQVRGCTREEKKVILDRVLRDLIGDRPEQEYALPNPDGSCYLHLVPPPIHVRYTWTPERAAAAQRSLKEGKLKPFSEVIARLEAMEQSQPSEE
jgi:hypothetical protein